MVSEVRAVQLDWLMRELVFYSVLQLGGTCLRIVRQIRVPANYKACIRDSVKSMLGQ